MLRAITSALRSLFLRHGFCSQGEHKRETVKPEFGHLVYRCMDCGRTREIGAVFVHGSNRRIRQ
jgi:uncharacterized Zn finger protein